MFQVFKSPCQNCLLSKDRIVSPARAKQIIEECKQNETHFICHKSTIKDQGSICCKNFFDKFPDCSQLMQVAARLNWIEFVEQTDSEKLTPYRK